jgi:uncharacterized membrane protein
MTEDLLVVVGVLVASAVCAWYVVQSISGMAVLIPADEVCETAAGCVPVALGY